MVNAPKLSYDAIMEALAAGHYYASTTPLFEGIWLERDVLHIPCSPVSSVYVHSRYLDCKTQDVRKTDYITHTELDVSAIRRQSPYLWVQLGTTDGKKAWSVPFWFDKE